MLAALMGNKRGFDRSTLTGVERHFDEGDIIVSKTNTRGIITYANEIFTHVAGFTEMELLGKPHSIMRHPAMPKGIFKFMWDRLRAGHEVFTYVINRAKNGDHYWVFAHVTPSYDIKDNIIGFHSSRRVAKPSALKVITPLYQSLLEVEKRHNNPKEAMEASLNALVSILNEQKVSYDEFILSL